MKQKIQYRQAKLTDAETLVQIYNESFYDDYIRYGQCPAYGRTKERMEESIEKYPKYLILKENLPIGAISFQNQGDGRYYVGCLCVIPKYQGMGIGTKAFQDMLSLCQDWNEITLITPADKEQNVRFYTQKCGFTISHTEMDGNVKVFSFILTKK